MNLEDIRTNARHKKEHMKLFSGELYSSEVVQIELSEVEWVMHSENAGDFEQRSGYILEKEAEKQTNKTEEKLNKAEKQLRSSE